MINGQSFINNILDDRTLENNLIFYSVFIAVYENLTDYVENHIQGLYCTESEIKEGKIVYKKSDEYKRLFCERIVDEKGNKNERKAQFLWLKDEGAIDETEYTTFLNSKERRNDFAHELLMCMCEGVSVEDRTLLKDVLQLYKKIDNWWIRTFEDIDCDNANEVHSVATDLVDIIMETVKLV